MYKFFVNWFLNFIHKQIHVKMFVFNNKWKENIKYQLKGVVSNAAVPKNIHILN